MARINRAPAIAFAFGRLLPLLGRLKPLRATLTAEPMARAAGEAARDLRIAVLWAVACHGLFGLAIGAMVIGMAFGMSLGLGATPAPWAWVMNAVLLAQFPLGHSFLVSRSGQGWLARLAPIGTGRTLATTTYVIVASLQLLILFVLWTPSGVIWWQAEGWLLPLLLAAYAVSWLIVARAIWDAGMEVQSGLLGWLSLLRGVRPHFPPMPETGLFAWIRQPIYVGFIFTLWTVPTWTPDQLLVAIVLTAYCLTGPLLKERRFGRLFGERFAAYRRQVPYCVPRLNRWK